MTTPGQASPPQPRGLPADGPPFIKRVVQEGHPRRPAPPTQRITDTGGGGAQKGQLGRRLMASSLPLGSHSLGNAARCGQNPVGGAWMRLWPPPGPVLRIPRHTWRALASPGVVPGSRGPFFKFWQRGGVCHTLPLIVGS